MNISDVSILPMVPFQTQARQRRRVKKPKLAQRESVEQVGVLLARVMI